MPESVRFPGDSGVGRQGGARRGAHVEAEEAAIAIIDSELLASGAVAQGDEARASIRLGGRRLNPGFDREVRICALPGEVNARITGRNIFDRTTVVGDAVHAKPGR